MKLNQNIKFLNVAFVVLFCLSSPAQAGGVGRGYTWFKEGMKWLFKTADDAPGAVKKADRVVDEGSVAKSYANGQSPPKQYYLDDFAKPIWIEPKDREVLKFPRVLIGELSTYLMRKDSPAPVLVAEAGVGKTALVKYLQIAIEDASNLETEPLRGFRILQVNMNDILGGNSLKGAFEEKLAFIIKQMQDPKNKNVIFAFDEMENIFKDKEQGEKFVLALKEPLTSGKMQAKAIFNMTPENYDKFVKTDAQFQGRLPRVYIEEPSDLEVKAIVQRDIEALEKYSATRFMPGQLELILKASKNHPDGLRNPRVVLTITRDAAINAMYEMQTGHRYIKVLQDRLDAVSRELESILKQREIAKQSNFKDPNSIKYMGPHYDIQIEALSKEIAEGKIIVNNYFEAFNATSEFRKALISKIEERESLLREHSRLLAASDPKALRLNASISTLTDDIFKLADDIREFDSRLPSIEVTNDHIITAAAKIRNESDRVVRDRILRGDTANRILTISEKLNGKYKDIISTIVNRARSLKIMGQKKDIPGILLLTNDKVAADNLVNEVVTELTGSGPYVVPLNKIKESSDMTLIEGSPPKYIGNDNLGKIYKSNNSGILFGGIDSAIPDVFKLIKDILIKKVLETNQNGTKDFSQAMVFLTSKLGEKLTAEHFDELARLKTTTEKQAFLRKFVLENNTNVDQFDEELLSKLHIVIHSEVNFVEGDEYLRASVFKALTGSSDQTDQGVVSNSLPSDIISSVSDQLEITVEYSSEVVDHLVSLIKKSGVKDVNQILHDEVLSVIASKVYSKEFTAGDAVYVHFENGQYRMSTLKWTSGVNRSEVISLTRATPVTEPTDVLERWRNSTEIKFEE